MAKKIVVTSGKGGVGKTTVTSNLGIALSNAGFRVALLDLDFGLNNLDVVMGLENYVSYDLQDVLCGRCRVKQALLQDRYSKNLFILPSGKVDVFSTLTGQNIKLIIDGISQYFDYVILDCPAGIDSGFHRAISCVDQAIVVTNPTLTSLRDAGKVISILKSYKMNEINVIVNKARGDLIINNKMISPIDITSLLNVDLIGVIPEEDVILLSNSRLPRNSGCAKSYKMICDNLVKGTKKIFDVTSKYSGFIGGLKRSLKGIVWTK